MSELDIVLSSDLFDERFYRSGADDPSDRATLAAHYLERGEREGRPPSLEFDPEFYAAANPDVALAVDNLLVHFVAFGRREGRYATRASVRRDAAKITRSFLYHPEDYEGFGRFAPLSGLSDVEAYLLLNHRFPAIGGRFDGAFYREHYPDGAAYGGAPIVHYLDIGYAESRVPTRTALEHRMAIAAPAFNAAHYLTQVPGPESACDPLRHFVLYGESAGHEPNREFSPDYYRRRNRAVVERGDSPFAHFVAYGQAEGRPGRYGVASRLRQGTLGFDPSKPGLVIVTAGMQSNDLSDFALELAERLGVRYNVVFVARMGGVREADFCERCCALLAGDFDETDAEYLLRELASSHRAEAVVVNGAACWEFGSGALLAGLPSVGLVHEFAEYALPAGRVTALVEFADRIVFPSQAAAASVVREVVEARGAGPRHIAIRAQARVSAKVKPPGELSASDVRDLLELDVASGTRVVLGAGDIDLRTGIDLFVEAAAKVREALGDGIRFVWLSANYRPNSDIRYSVWVADMIEKFGLHDHLKILDRLDDARIFLDVADVFFSPARMDGFPALGYEALALGKRVVCLEGAGGLSEAIERRPELGTIVRYCDGASAADAIVRECEAERTVRDADTARSHDEHDFGAYAAFVEEQIAAATRERRDVTEFARGLQERGGFDAAFHDGDPLSAGKLAAERALLAFAARAAHGFASLNPHAGFDSGAYLSGAREGGRANGAVRRLALRETATHRCVNLDALLPRSPAPRRIALHLHFHYPELAVEFRDLLHAAAAPMDLYVSTTTRARAAVESVFAEYRVGTVNVIAVPNVGRDIGPLLVDFARPLRRGRYDLIGHLHGKRSLSGPPGMGDRWRAHLLRTLVGDRENFAKILAFFEAEDDLGLVFAEDRYSVPWDANLPFAERLATELQPPPALPPWPIFPKGTMFWCRPDVLAPLWERPFATADFPAEPLPDDGSLLHAIERMLPSIAEACGYRWATLERDGSGW